MFSIHTNKKKFTISVGLSYLLQIISARALLTIHITPLPKTYFWYHEKSTEGGLAEISHSIIIVGILARFFPSPA